METNWTLFATWQHKWVFREKGVCGIEGIGKLKETFSVFDVVING